MSAVLNSSNPGSLISFNHLIRSSNLILSTPPFNKGCNHLHASHTPSPQQDALAGGRSHQKGPNLQTPPC
ncbi:hypothetical protein CLIM01_08541 [Colletotrichum limetticola]|uniref:Uncharacterized protein n=1 Tax=Colletotrichum limetticola TaxID=1209924 RepID=A0ABQ9PRD3_9PEZI|nr:hypothetical protein CLIM01_08541 [Colletotrichum limetticola]